MNEKLLKHRLTFYSQTNIKVIIKMVEKTILEMCGIEKYTLDKAHFYNFTEFESSKATTKI